MTKLRGDPISVISVVLRRVLLLSLFVTAFLAVASYLLEWSIIQVLIGFWVGVIVNSISFYLIAIGAHKLLEKSKKGMSAHVVFGLLGRLILYAVSLFLLAQISLHALVASAVGFSMVGLVLKLNGFLPIGADTSKEKE